MTDNLLDPNTQNTPTNPLVELVGEGRKFRTAEDLAKGKIESDSYIKVLESQLDKMRTDYLGLKSDYDSRAKLEELIDRLPTRQQQLTSNEQNPPVNEARNQPMIDPNQIESLVSNAVQKIETNKKYTDNFNTVRGKLIEQYGENYQTVLNKQAVELGYTEADVNDMARKSPRAFFKTFDLDTTNRQTETFQAPPRNQQRSDTFAPRTQERTWAYYEDMRKKDPTLYYDSKTQVQLHKDILDLGDRFNDGNWKEIGQI